MASRTPRENATRYLFFGHSSGLLVSTVGEGEKHKERQRVGAGTRIGKRYRDMGIVKEEGKQTRNISKATVKPQMATPKLQQWDGSDYYSLAPAFSKPAAPAFATDRYCTAGREGDRWGLATEMTEIPDSIMQRPRAGDCNLGLINPQWREFLLIFCEYSQMRP